MKTGIKYILLFALLGLEINTASVVKQPVVPEVKKETQSSTNQAKKETPSPKPKKITNTITKKDIGYKYLFVTRYPEKFTITVNNKELKAGESTTIDTDTFEAGYAYEWWAPWQIYKGSGTKKYHIPAAVDEVQVTFTDWHNPARIKVANAELIEQNNTIADTKKSDKGKKRHGK